MARSSEQRSAEGDALRSDNERVEDDEDKDEWRTVTAAFRMYKAAYGDLKVPSRFVVPGMAPWPGE